MTRSGARTIQSPGTSLRQSRSSGVELRGLGSAANDGLLTNLLTNRSVFRGTEAHISDRSPRSPPGIRSSRLSMAWKESERRT
jgi:hypothetical protein